MMPLHPSRRQVLGGALATLAIAPRAASAHVRRSWIPDRATLDDLPRAMRVAGVPGVGVAVVERGRLAWSRGFGVANAVTRQPVTDDTLFEAASMTKPLAAWLVMRLVDDGRLALDAPLIGYVRPEYLAADDPALHRITVRDALRHTSGLPNWGAAPLRTQQAPGVGYTYSGEAFVWLQLAVETVTGKGFGVVAREKLFAPAGMARSYFGWDAAIARAAAWGHAAPDEGDGALPPQPGRDAGELLLPVARRWGRPITDWTTADELRAYRELAPHRPVTTRDLLINAAGGLFVTAADYARFMALMMDGPRHGDWDLTEASRRAMLTPILDVRGPDFARGLGWQIERSADGPLFEHSGSNYGIFKTLGVGDAVRGRAIVVFTNGANGSALAQRIVRQATGLELLKFLA